MRARAAACALWLCTATVLGGCGIGKTVSDFMDFGEDAPAVPITPLAEFEPLIEPERLWSVDTGSGEGEAYLGLQPAIGSERAYSAEYDGDVLAVGLENGRKLWSVDTDSPLSGGPGADGALVVVGNADGEVIALADSDGAQLWRTRVSSEVLAAPAIGDDIVVVRSGDSRLYGLDADSGRRRWVYDRQSPTLTLRGTSPPIIAAGLVVAGFDGGRVVALELDTGRPAWEFSVGLPSGRTDLDRMVDIDAEPVYLDGVVYVASFQGRVAAIDIFSGNLLWSRDISSYAGLATDGLLVYLSDDIGRIWALDARTGNSVWRQDDLGGRRPTAPGLLGGYLAVGDFEGYLHWLNASSGEFVARNRVGSVPMRAKPVTVEDRLLVYDTAGELAAYRVP